jgi:hypothetical protein
MPKLAIAYHPLLKTADAGITIPAAGERASACLRGGLLMIPPLALLMIPPTSHRLHPSTESAPGLAHAGRLWPARDAWIGQLAALLAAASFFAVAPAALADEYYLARLVYPGTYGNFCGPTPEFPRGWHGDQPVDAVDRACQSHDAAYGVCRSGVLQRKGPAATPPLLSVLTALRATGLTSPYLESIGVDSEYMRCVHSADQGLIRDGLEVRGSSQRNACADDPYTNPSWFCNLKSLTLSRIERVDFDLFLANLDWDDNLATAGPRPRLTELEGSRRASLAREAARVPLPKAAESVQGIEAEMYKRLRP